MHIALRRDADSQIAERWYMGSWTRAVRYRVSEGTLTPLKGVVVPGPPFSVFTFENEAKRQAMNA